MLPNGAAPNVSYLAAGVLITPTGHMRLRLPARYLYPAIEGTYAGATIVSAESPHQGVQFFQVTSAGTATAIGKPYQDYNGNAVLAVAAGRLYVLGCAPDRIGPCSLTQVSARTGAPLHVLNTYAVVLYADANGALITGGKGVQRWHPDGSITPVASVQNRYDDPVFINPLARLLVVTRSPYNRVSRIASPDTVLWRIDEHDMIAAAAPDGSAVIDGGGNDRPPASPSTWRGPSLRLVNANTGAVEHTFTFATGYYGRALLFEDAQHFLAIIGRPIADSDTQWLVRCSTTGFCTRLTGPTHDLAFPITQGD